jgi:phospholipid/cholesterol/gamma-HCH transport system ATP-binding protein
LYDEPTTMVDPIMIDHITRLMLRLKNQLRLTGVVVTHDLDLMRNVADLEKSDHPHIQEFLAMDRV